jgi:primosomal protein N''
MIAEVIVDIKVKAVDRIFDYIVPDNLTVTVGSRVYAPFGNQKIEGYIINLKPTSEMPFEQLKELISVSEVQFLNEELVALAKEFAQRTACFKTSMLQAMVPKDVTRREIKKVEAVVALKTITIPTRAKKQREVIDYLQSVALPVTLPFLRKIFGNSVITKLIAENFFSIEKLEVELINDPVVISPQKQIELRQEQKNVLAKLTDNQGVFVLQGITGSGKTEIYLRYVEQIIAQNKTVLILVPEIGLTPQMIERFAGRFGEKNLALLHSKLTARKRFDMWVKIKRQQVKIVLGTRSAIFAPLENIGAIILDEEHDSSYKQENSPSYNAKEIAIWRGEYHQANVILASATPSLESYVRAQKGLYTLLELKERQNIKAVNVEIVDMRNYIGDEKYRYISQPLEKAIITALDNNEQIILMLNRRGYATTIQCTTCGHVCECSNCDTSLVYHKNEQKLRCHYCQYEEQTNLTCPNCNNKMFQTGVGIQKVEESLTEFFPTARILRADRDVITTLADYQQFYQAFNNGEADILLGTQMIAKGFDFPNVTVVGVLEIDQLFNIPDLRAREKAYQLLRQVIGRAGRGGKNGQAFLQTYDIEQPLLKEVQVDEYEKFAQKELSLRQQFNNPPYWHLSDLIIAGENLNEVASCANYMYGQLQRLDKYLSSYPPAPTFIKRVQNRYHYHILIKYKNADIVVKNIQTLLEVTQKNYTKVYSYLQVNPINFL